jgi:hypothetical protein
MAGKQKAPAAVVTALSSVGVWVSGLTQMRLEPGKTYQVVPTPEGWDKRDHEGQLARIAKLPPGSVPQYVADIAVQKGGARFGPAED